MASAAPLIGGGFSAVGQVNETQDKAWQLEDEAIIAEKNAKLARETGAYNAKRQELETNQRIGAIQADVGASGIASDSGNILDVLRQSAVNAELDRQTILRGSELQARNFDLRASQARVGARETKKAGALNVASTLFGAGARTMERGGGGNGKIADNTSGVSGTGGHTTMSDGRSFGQRGM